jgi:N-acetylglucosamine-6-sulfatase
MSARRRSRREFLRGLGGATLAALGSRGLRASAASGPPARRPPDLLVILSDNHRWDAWGGAGHPFVRTPALDRLAREGVVFANAFCTTPLCSPARASFLTGRYAWQHGVWNNSDRGAWDDANVTFLETLARAGYRTAFLGKWHMPGSGLPRLRGVDHFVTFTIQDGQGRYFDCPLVVDGRPEPSRKAYLPEELTDRAIALLAAPREAPACVYLSHKSVHHPWRPAPDHDDLYADAPVELPPGANSWTGFTNGEIFGGFERPIESAIRRYMATVTSMDREIGRLLDALDAHGLADDTVVVYVSDNGFLFGEHGHVELRWPFEEVIRIPFLVRAPSAVREPGRRVEALALNLDLGPTLLDLAGAPVPGPMQGMSLAPALAEPGFAGRRAFLVENHREFPYNAPSYRGVRTDRWLYVEYEGRFEPTLHDVVADPGQRHDLMGTPEAERVLPELRAMLEALKRGERLDG